MYFKTKKMEGREKIKEKKKKKRRKKHTLLTTKPK